MCVGFVSRVHLLYSRRFVGGTYIILLTVFKARCIILDDVCASKACTAVDNVFGFDVCFPYSISLRKWVISHMN